MLNKLHVQEKLKQFYLEDNHYGDLSSSIFDINQHGTLTLLSKDEGVFVEKSFFKKVSKSSKVIFKLILQLKMEIQLKRTSTCSG